MGRILCAWSPNWAIANWRRRNPSGSPASPFALVESVRGVRRLAALDECAQALGLYRGQKATEAAALVQDLASADAEPEADASALTVLAHWCVRFSPAVAEIPPDGLFLDVTGLAHLWGGEGRLLDDLQERLARNGLPFRLGLADTPGAAWALAHFAADRSIAPPGAQAALLAPLPPAALRLELEAAAQLERLGLRTVGQLAALPRAPLAQRFGIEALNRLDQALGRSEEALVFRRPPNPWFARLAFAEPLSTPEDLGRVAHDIAVLLCARLERESRGARRFMLGFHRVDGRAETVEVALSRAARDAARIAKLFVARLETVDPGFGVEVATLSAEAVEPLSQRQARLDARHDLQDDLAPLIDRLANRLGEARVWTAAPFESHVPELSVVRRPPLDTGVPGRWDPERPRPVRLFRRPEPLEGVVALTPDEPPRQFRWRRRLHRIRRAEGPERIASEWWRGPIEDAGVGQVRDYYRVENEDGGRLWVFREGLYDAKTEPKWWVHGLFG